MADQRGDVEPAAATRSQDGLLQPQTVPAGPAAARDRTDLGADELDPVVVELLAEAEAGGVALIEAGGNDAPVRPDRCG